ncbi:hypothetical protein Lfu02_03710 [Longispora fulva]|uniref:Amino acid adenylation domain-containing protein n=1 Tax=Longispora fulva TaxID=619741 RepID=A0A8J7GCD0_9ACTN|nr:amino acid adenylation domain-containing protein [Longispora fulva]MBG6135760.1 amino acid adenylation domain-containing protein [Longispora fulva]GIG55999.1 hypothetical protein Lfu02_03710 [Longispora fulva]
MDSLVARFAARVAAAPGAPAVVDGALSLSYADLDRWSDAVHARLLAEGVREGQLVGLSVSRGARAVAGIIGILKAGCAYVPLDPAYPAARRNLMTADSGVPVVLVDAPDRSAGVAAGAVRTAVLPGPFESADRTTSSWPVDADAPAYVIYTSGSTGTPKGVPVRHRQILDLFDASARHFTFLASDAWTLFHSHSFDFSVWEMWGALLHGARLVCVPDSARVVPAGFVELLVRERITVLNAVPSVFGHLLRGTDHAMLALRYVVFGGESVDPAALAGWLVPGAPELVNMYGITETTVHVTHRRMTTEDLRFTGPGTLIGVPLPHLDVLLLDVEGRPVPAGARGELHVGGSGVADGYLGRPELTASRFPVLPGLDGEPCRYFRSGDMASWSAEHGSLVYHGRLDDQVQIRGFRIELGEVEAALRAGTGVAGTGVADAVVAVERNDHGEDVLVACVVPAGMARPSARALRREVALTLPRHMVPERIRVIDELPRTASGKVDRRNTG